LLADLIERGLATNRALLIVIDGAKALHKAVIEVFGAHALIQRCREHKKTQCYRRPAGVAARFHPQCYESGLRAARPASPPISIMVARSKTPK
jgi:hypothetical protein